VQNSWTPPLFPAWKSPQERHYGLPWFAARHGDRSLIEKVIAAAEPFDATLKDLCP
jgi:hypothetical protein